MLRTQWEERIIDQRLERTWRTWIVLLGKSTENHDLHQVSTGVKMGMGQNPGT